MNITHYRISFILSMVSFALMLLATNAYAGDKIIIGFPEDNMSNDWRAAQVREIKQELAKHKNVQFLTSDAAGSVAKNILDIENMVNQGAQLLFLGPKNPDAIAPIAKKIRKQGVRIVLLTRRLKTDDFDVYISPSDYKIAYQAGLHLARNINGKGQILMLEGVPSTTTAIERKKGFLAALKKFPKISIIYKVANYSRTDAIFAIEELLKSKQKFDAIYAHNDAMAAGARFALKQAGIKPASVPTVGIDFLPETRQAIINGEQLASFTYPTCGKVGVKAALALLKGKKVSRYIEVPSQKVTKKNVKKIHTAY